MRALSRVACRRPSRPAPASRRGRSTGPDQRRVRASHAPARTAVRLRRAQAQVVSAERVECLVLPEELSTDATCTTQPVVVLSSYGVNRPMCALNRLVAVVAAACGGLP